jgi:Spherulation-specific family 4
MSLPRLLTTFIIVTCAMSCPILDLVESNSSQLPNAITNTLTPQLIAGEKMGIDRLVKNRSPLKILIPLYIYPNWYDRDKYLWKQVALAAKRVPIVAIINPNNGPDRAPPNLDYQQGMKDLQQAGVKLVGYVPSNYGNRDLQAVKADIDIYAKHFPVEGIFIDETASAQSKLEYYHQIYQHIKSRSKSYQTIVNPGNNLDESHLQRPIADTFVTFENYQKAWDKYRSPAYVYKYSPQHFAALIHTTANSKLMRKTIDRAAKHNFGYVYITNDSTDTANKNPWDSLPSFWHTQVEYIQKINNAKL